MGIEKHQVKILGGSLLVNAALVGYLASMWAGPIMPHPPGPASGFEHHGPEMHGIAPPPPHSRAMHEKGEHGGPEMRGMVPPPPPPHMADGKPHPEGMHEKGGHGGPDRGMKPEFSPVRNLEKALFHVDEEYREKLREIIHSKSKVFQEHMKNLDGNLEDIFGYLTAPTFDKEAFIVHDTEMAEQDKMLRATLLSLMIEIAITLPDEQRIAFFKDVLPPSAPPPPPPPMLQAVKK